MRFYIVEDEISVIAVLENLIEEAALGTVCGSSQDGTDAAEEILEAKPDIVLVDFLMPKKDGIALVQELKTKGICAKIVMLSQVSSKDLISKAYQAGVDFFVSKPVNQIEICSVLRKVEKELKNEQMLLDIRKLFREETPADVPKPHAASGQDSVQDALEKAISAVLGQLGMLGERGTKDIVRICLHMHEHGIVAADAGLGFICRKLSDEPKSMEQRIRRAIAVGMKNLAHIGIEDYMNDTFVSYSNTLFSFEDIRAEMDYARGKRMYGGKTDVKKFLDSLLAIAERNTMQG